MGEEIEGLDRLFFDLASESRLSILREIQQNSMKMQPLARKLDLTDTEAFRQLQRLNEALLIQKQPDGTYTLTQYGKLVLQFAHSFEFAFKHKQCLLTRDIWRLPSEFIDRLGELHEVTLSMDTIEMVNNAEKLFEGAEKYMWIIGEKPLGFVGAKVSERVQKGVSLRFMTDEKSAKYYQTIPEIKNVVEKRVVPTLPAILLLTEKFGGVNLLSIDGRADNAVFYGKDPAFMKWATDLFLHYWNQAARF
jgi:predicted transcriptional regulator